ncbi:MAG: hypothetical protein HFE63_09140 [Clostridiales bacterium]|nr:hypothetical protein [Clostridiales bacterium]
MNKKNYESERLQSYLNAIIDLEIDKDDPDMDLINKCSALLDKIEKGAYEPDERTKRRAIRAIQRKYIRQGRAKYVKLHKLSAAVCACIIAMITSFFTIKAEVCEHEWVYFGRTWDFHSQRCVLCGYVVRGVEHDGREERKIPCVESYHCSCGEFIVGGGHYTFWTPISDSKHQLICDNPYCDYVIRDSIEECEFESMVSETSIGKVHEGYDICQKCGNSRRNAKNDQLCTGADCQYCKK